MSWFGRARRKHRILILGPESSGKTTLMYRLSNQPVPESMMPTAAPVLEKFVESPDNHKFTFAEQKTETPGASAIIYVLTSSDLQSSVSALKQYLASTTAARVPLLVLVNKLDNSADLECLDRVCADITPLVGVERSWAVSGCSGTENKGVTEAMEWLQTKLPMF